MSRLQLAPVAQDLTDFEAKVVTARLGADGILWELRGVVDSLYPLGRIDVLVPVDELEDARASLRDVPAGRGDDHGHPPVEARPGHRPVASRRGWVTVAVVAGLAVFAAARMAATIASFQEPMSDDCAGAAQAATEGLTRPCRR